MIKHSNIYSILYCIKRRNLYGILYIIFCLSIIYLVLFIFGFKIYQRVEKNKLKETTIKYIEKYKDSNIIFESNNKNRDFDFYSVEKSNNNIEFVGYKNGYCIAKLLHDSEIQIFASVSHRCELINSPNIKHVNSNKLYIEDENPEIYNYIIFGNDVSTIDNDLNSNKIDIVIENNDKKVISINLDGHRQLIKLGNVTDAINYKKGVIVRRIGALELNKLDSLTVMIKNNYIYYNRIMLFYNDGTYEDLILSNKQYNDLYKVIKNKKYKNKIFYYTLMKEDIENIYLPRLNINKGDSLKIKEGNSLGLYLYSKK